MCANRDLTHWARQPAAVITNSLLFPIMIVLMFGYLLGGAIIVPGGGNYREFLMPGMFAMAMVFGIGATLVAVSSDAARGVTDRFRSMPMAPSAVVVGRATADMLNSVVTLTVLIACGLRDLFGNPAGAVGDSWIAQHPLLMAIAWPLLITAVFFPLSVQRYRRLSH